MPRYDKKRRTWRAMVMIDGVRYQKRGFITKKSAELWEAQEGFDILYRALIL